jgi:hypothetical protein
MTTRNTILTGLLIGMTLATPVLARPHEACLQHNRVKSWRPVNDHTMVFADTFDRRYTVRTYPRCEGLDMTGARLVFHTWENLQCLRRGQIISVIAPGIGRTTCAIASVTTGTPAPGLAAG